jgi:hypothetical protein
MSVKRRELVKYLELDMESEEIGIVLVQPAVFTPPPGPLPDEGPESGIHQSPSE